MNVSQVFGMNEEDSFVFGHRGVGKTAIYHFWKDLDPSRFELYDLDVEIERNLNESILSFFKKNGEDLFRKKELEVFFDLLSREAQNKKRIIFLGAGFPVEKLKNKKCIWLKRVSDNEGRIFFNRPNLTDKSPLDEFFEKKNARDVEFKKLGAYEFFLPEKITKDYGKLIFEYLFKSKQIPSGTVTVLPENFWILDPKIQKSETYIEVRQDLTDLKDFKSWLKSGYLSGFKGVLISLRIDSNLKKWISFIKDLSTESLTQDGQSKISKVFWVDVDQELLLSMSLETLASFAPHEIVLSSHGDKPPESLSAAKILKWAPEVDSILELRDMELQLSKLDYKVCLLPQTSEKMRSQLGLSRWAWYRVQEVRGLLSFYRFGMGSSDDQPHWWEICHSENQLSKAVSKKEQIRYNRRAVIGEKVGTSLSPVEQQQEVGFPMFRIPLLRHEFNRENMSWMKHKGVNQFAVTSPFKAEAFEIFEHLAQKNIQHPASFELYNSLKFEGFKMSAKFTDATGFKEFAKSHNFHKLQWIVIGRGALLPLLESVLNVVSVVSARQLDLKASDLEVPNLVWACGNTADVKNIPLDWRIENIIDLDYKECSLGRELSLIKKAKYFSGHDFFIHQALKQRRFFEQK